MYILYYIIVKYRIWYIMLCSTTDDPRGPTSALALRSSVTIAPGRSWIPRWALG